MVHETTIRAVLAVVPSLLFLAGFLRVVRQSPESPRLVGGAYLTGGLAFGAAVALAQLFAGPLAGVGPELRPWVWTGPVEEALKLGAVLVAAGRPQRWGRMTAGLVYAVAAALGFAMVENLAYAHRYGLDTTLLRAVTAVPGHALHGALVGVQLGRGSWTGVLLGLLLAAGAHGAYDALLLQPPAIKVAVVPLLALEGLLLASLLRRASTEDLARVVAQLRTLPGLAEAPASSLRLLATRARRRRVRAGTPVIEQGQDSNSVFLVLEGALSVGRTVDGRQEAVGELSRGDWFGELGLLLGRKRSAGVRTESDALLLELSRTGLHEAVEAVDGLADELLDASREHGARSAEMAVIDELEDEATTAEAHHLGRLDPAGLPARLGA